jgi:hypothetical protein
MTSASSAPKMTRKPPTIHDLTGSRYGRLCVISPKGIFSGRKKWVCKCDCGGYANVLTSSLTSGKTKSCGCIVRKHGAVGTRAYSIWREMHKRCGYPKAKDFIKYGARGISVCPEWSSFQTFLCDMGAPPTDKHSIDRRDGNLGYSKANCRWATAKEQMRNRRSNKLVEFGGETKCLSEWEELKGLRRGILGRRLRRGWPIEEAMTPQGSAK